VDFPARSPNDSHRLPVGDAEGRRPAGNGAVRIDVAQIPGLDDDDGSSNCSRASRPQKQGDVPQPQEDDRARTSQGR